MSDDTLLQFMLASAGQAQRQETLPQQQNPPANSNWLLSFAAKYFDVTTTDVVERILWSAIPVRKIRDADHGDELMEPLTSETKPLEDTNEEETYASKRPLHLSYMERFIQSRPDFYGPFWISCTLVFVVAILSNIASFIQYSSRSDEKSLLTASSTNNSNGHVDNESNKLEGWFYSMDELNMTSSLIMIYLTLVPTMFWFLFWFRGCSKYYTLTETLCAYGYSLSIFIPMALILTIQVVLVRYVMITIAAALSGGVLLLSFLPVAQSDPNPASCHIILALVPACQFGLAYVIHRIMLI